MNAKLGHVILVDSPATSAADWDDALTSRSTVELRAKLATRRARGPGSKPPKQSVTVRFSPEVIDYFRATGNGWQTRMDDALREYVAARH
jgi:uncharacterized protein (DUF4415 family)